MKPAVISLAGLPLFLWPFLAGAGVADSPAAAVVAATLLALLLVEAGTRGLDSRRLALLAAIAAVDAGLRLMVVVGIGGFSPIFFLVLCAGWVYGPSFGFLAGASALLVSALATGGVGPWIPFQVFATGWAGALAGVAGRPFGGRATPAAIAVLALTGVLTGFLFGALMDVQGWVNGFRGSPDAGWLPGMAPATALVHFGRYYLLTSLAYDGFRAAGNALMVLLLGPPVVAALRRLRLRSSFEIVPVPHSL